MGFTTNPAFHPKINKLKKKKKKKPNQEAKKGEEKSVL
jgi:hypothetical protein